MPLPHIITNQIRATISRRSWLGSLVSTHPLIASLSVIPACVCMCIQNNHTRALLYGSTCLNGMHAIELYNARVKSQLKYTSTI